MRIAKANGWPGYLADLPLAMGAQGFALSPQKVNEMAMQILDGLDYRKIPQYVEEMHPLNVAGEDSELEYERTQEKGEQNCLKAHKIQ